MQIIPDPLMMTLQAIPFLVTVLALYYIIFKPMLAYLDERANSVEIARSEASNLQAQIEARMSDYEAKLAQARAETAELRAKRRAEAMVAYNESIKAARADADQSIGNALVEIGDAKATAAKELEANAVSLADQITGRVLRRAAAG